MTSYVKMIDIWMLFTMTVPFLEVALHTCTEVMRRQGMPKFLAPGWVKPEDQLDLEVPRVVTAWVGVVGRLMVSITSILFTAIFWITGLIFSYWPHHHQDPGLSNRITIVLN